MNRHIRPADEEIENAIPLLFFVILWYTAIIRQMTQSFQPFLCIFLIAGVLPLYTFTQSMRRAFFYRQQRKQAIAYGRTMHGTITGVAQKMIPYSGKNGRLRFQKYYYLQVEVFDPATGGNYTIESQAYRKPIHRYLASPKVLVYTDKSGFKYYVEEFQWKKSKNEPDIFTYPEEFDELHHHIPVFQIVFVLIVIWMLFNLMR